jgi:hypothetical protein
MVNFHKEKHQTPANHDRCSSPFSGEDFEVIPICLTWFDKRVVNLQQKNKCMGLMRVF